MALRVPRYTILSCTLALLVEWLLHRGTEKASTIIGVAILLTFVLLVAFIEMNRLIQHNALILDTPRNNTIWLVPSDLRWAEDGNRYHGGRILAHQITEMLSGSTVIACAISDAILADLGKLYEVDSTSWARREVLPMFNSGDYVMIMHGDPSTMFRGQSARENNFWIEVAIIDKVAAWKN